MFVQLSVVDSDQRFDNLCCTYLQTLSINMRDDIGIP